MLCTGVAAAGELTAPVACVLLPDDDPVSCERRPCTPWPCAVWPWPTATDNCAPKPVDGAGASLLTLAPAWLPLNAEIDMA
jgi:hypothetical protein